MTYYENHLNMAGARGGVWHLHSVPAAGKPLPETVQEQAQAPIEATLSSFAASDVGPKMDNHPAPTVQADLFG